MGRMEVKDENLQEYPKRACMELLPIKRELNSRLANWSASETYMHGSTTVQRERCVDQNLNLVELILSKSL